MLTFGKQLKIYYFRHATDMRKSFDGLSALISEQLQLDPLSGALFVFRNRRGDRVKLLYWDGDGWALWYKRLESGTFEAPRSTDNARYATLSSSELTLLLDGVDLRSIRRRKRFQRAG